MSSAAARIDPSHHTPEVPSGPTVGRHIGPSYAASAPPSVSDSSTVRASSPSTRLTSSRLPSQPAKTERWSSVIASARSSPTFHT